VKKHYTKKKSDCHKNALERPDIFCGIGLASVLVALPHQSIAPSQSYKES